MPALAEPEAATMPEAKSKKMQSIFVLMGRGLQFLVIWSAIMTYRSFASVFGVKTDATDRKVKATFLNYLVTTVFIIAMVAIIANSAPVHYVVVGLTGLVLVLEIPYLAALAVEYHEPANTRTMIKRSVGLVLMFFGGVYLVEYPNAAILNLTFWVTWLTAKGLLGVETADEALHREEVRAREKAEAEA